MADTPLVQVEKVAARVGINPVDNNDKIVDAILDAQDAVEGYLGRSIIPVEEEFTGVSPAWGAVDLDDPAAWPSITLAVDETWTVVSRTAVPADNTWDVTAAVGLDASTNRTILSYIKAHAVELLRNDPTLDGVQRPVRSLSREGQSLTFETGSVAEGAAGAPPNLKSLKRWKRAVIFRRRTVPAPLWPN